MPKTLQLKIENWDGEVSSLSGSIDTSTFEQVCEAEIVYINNKKVKDRHNDPN